MTYDLIKRNFERGLWNTQQVQVTVAAGIITQAQADAIYAGVEAPPGGGGTPEEIARAERDRLLSESDYALMPDYGCSDAERDAWVVYRQALRDITEQEGFPDVIEWPIKPAREKANDTILGIIDAMIGGANV